MSVGVRYSLAEPHISTAIWLTQLRWVAVAGQLLVIGSVVLLVLIPLPLLPLLALVAWTAATNIGLWVWARRLRSSSALTLSKAGYEPRASLVADSASDDTIGNRVLTAILCMDVVTLTGLLYFTGGGSNPFLIFYFANIAIAGMILPRQLAWLVAFLSVGGVSWLLNEARSIDVIANSPLDPNAPWGVSKFAFLVAFATSSCVITFFVTMLAGQLREREKQLAIAEQEKERSRRLEAMATLAAGAGHELASPLSTIAVVSKELSRNLEKYEVSSGIRRDVDLIREELNRCRDILHRMKSGAGEAAAEHLHPISLAELVEETIQAMREPHRVVVDLPTEIEGKKGLLPKQALSQALRNLIQNGLDASPPEAIVTLTVREQSNAPGLINWKLTITDSGTGLSEEVSRRIGEPFFTTKEVGQGMGLGVFLTRNVIQGVGGTMKFISRIEGGTICEVEIPTKTV
ncbi:ATP-binding protein [Pirellulaceae bacterium SH467]